MPFSALTTMKPFINNWKCLADFTPDPKPTPIHQKDNSLTSKPNPGDISVSTQKTHKAPSLSITPEQNTTITPFAVQKQAKTFAQAVTNIFDIPSSQLPQPVIKGDRLSIVIPEEEYNDGMTACKFNLHARILWAKGSTPLTVQALKSKLSIMWKDLSQWGIQFLGKGFYELTFSRLEDVKRVRSVASWKLNPGIMKLFAWTRDFSPSLQNSTNAQVWVRIYGLAQEYWRPRILFAIAGSVGTPICTDSASSKPMIERSFGQFARVLVDMDISQTLRYKVLVERKDYAFFVELDYENMPDFCTNCRKIGHCIDVCKFLNKSDSKKDDIPVRNDVADISNEEKINKRVWIKQGKSVANPIIVDNISNADKNVSVLKTTKIVGNDGAGTSGEKASEEIQQKNKFEVLVNNMRLQDLELENDINKEFQSGEGTNSQDTEFVEDTLIAEEGIEDLQVDDGEEVISRSQLDVSIVNHLDDEGRRLEMEKRNKEFLNQSWANMAEDVDAETRLLKDLEKSPIENNDDDSFQVVKPKSKFKNKKASFVRNYGTRNKTGKKQPFK